MNTTYIFAVLAVIVLGFGVWIVAQSDDITTDETRLTSTKEEHHTDKDDTGYEMYPEDVAAKMASGEDIILLDVRTLEEYKELHLENALLLPVQDLSQQSLAAIGLGENMKDKEIILYCRSGARSETAYKIMTSLGYTNIKSVAGGMIHWEEDNYPYTEAGAYKGPTFAHNAAAESTVTTGPRVSVDRTIHEFGVIPQFGGTVATKFTITNLGTEVLEIGQLTTSCSCTSATISSSFIKPGEEAELTVVFDPDFHEEPVDVFKRTIFIPTNDPNNSEIEVAVQMDIAEGE